MPDEEKFYFVRVEGADTKTIQEVAERFKGWGDDSGVSSNIILVSDEIQPMDGEEFKDFVKKLAEQAGVSVTDGPVLEGERISKGKKRKK